MFKVGEYEEDEAKQVAQYLRDAGFKVDIRGLVQARSEITASLEGKISEMKGRLGEIEVKILPFEDYERFLAALKEVLEKGATKDNYKDLFLNEVIPNWNEKKEKFEASKGTYEDLDAEARKEILEPIVDSIVSLGFAEKVLEINGINPGEPIEGRLDDPLISIPVNPDDYDPDDPMLRERMDIDLDKDYEILIDEFYTPLYHELDEDFQEEYSEEYINIKALGGLIEDLIDEPAEGKIDIEEFADMCMIDIGDKAVISLDASLVAEEIARSLEKKGIIKMKGNTIKWKA